MVIETKTEKEGIF